MLLDGNILPTKDYTTLKSPKGSPISGLKEHCANPLFHKTGQVSRERRKNFVTSQISSRGSQAQYMNQDFRLSNLDKPINQILKDTI